MHGFQENVEDYTAVPNVLATSV